MCVHIIHFVIPADIISHRVGGRNTWNEPRGQSNWKFKWVFPWSACVSECTCECIYRGFIQSVSMRKPSNIFLSCTQEQGSFTIMWRDDCKKKESREVLWPWKLLTWMLFLHSWLWMIVSLLWLLSSAQWTDVFIVCVKQRLSADQIFTLASASMLGNTGGKTLWVWEKNFKHAETVKHKWAKRNNPERDGGRFWSLVLQTHCY